MTATTKLAVVLGAGQVGSLVAERLRSRGLAVRQVRRSGASSKDVLVGDLADPGFAGEAGRGASVIVHCAVPPYHQWASLLEPLNEGALHAAKTSGARLVVLDNLYGYGRPSGPMSETTPVAPISRKGALRAKVAERLLSAHRAGDARVSLARASDFYGPGVTLSGVFGERFFQRVLAGKTAEVFGDADALHSYSYAPDVADGLVTLALDERADGEVWHLPVAAPESTRQWVQRFGRALGRELTVSKVPALALRFMGLFAPAAGEMVEMLYQWEALFVLDDSKFRAAFEATATPADVGVEATIAWAKGAFGRRVA
ncbi:MAG: NAD-dependent epimerase/dehydratase family protein [Myxococcaceae bacterium]|nr:NAD-dependent epimerase/dehydratase family protein [Myxococcaceae bacterium]